MEHYAIDKMNLRDRETVYWPVIQWGHQDYISQMQHFCKFARTQQKETLQSVETPQTVGITWFRHLPIKRHIVFTNSWLLQLVPSCEKTAESPLNECNQILKEIFTERGVPKCILRWWHSIHLVRVLRLHKKWQIEHRVASSTNAV